MNTMLALMSLAVTAGADLEVSDPAPVPESPASAPTVDVPRERPAAWRRHAVQDELGPTVPGDELPAGVLAGSERPLFLLRRTPWVGGVLGAVIGFGTGSYYVGESETGHRLAAVDAAMVVGLLGSTVALNQRVIHNDFRTERSLARGEREMGGREQAWFALAWTAGLGLVCSRVVQAWLGVEGAHRTNETLERFAFVPLGAPSGWDEPRPGLR